MVHINKFHTVGNGNQMEADNYVVVCDMVNVYNLPYAQSASIAVMLCNFSLHILLSIHEFERACMACNAKEKRKKNCFISVHMKCFTPINARNIIEKHT